MIRRWFSVREKAQLGHPEVQASGLHIGISYCKSGFECVYVCVCVCVCVRARVCVSRTNS